MFCNPHPLVKEIENGVAFKPLRCRSWNCESCRKIRKRQVISEAQAGSPLIFVTLTLPGECSEDPLRWARELINAWRKFVRFYKARHDLKSIPYFAVMETTKAGTPHMHVLCRTPWIEHGTLSWFMEREVGAPNVWIERVRHRRKAAKYLAKYMGKAPAKIGTLKRYWQTKDYSNPEPPPRRPVRDGFKWYNKSEWNLFHTAIMYSSIKGYDCKTIDGILHYTKPRPPP